MATKSEEFALVDSTSLSLDGVQNALVGILSDMTSDWGVATDGALGPATRLVADLEFTSVDIIHLIVAIEEHFKHPGMGFQELLMKDNRYVDELTVEQIAVFVSAKLSGELK